MPDFDREMRKIHFALITLFALLTGAAAGLLDWLETQHVAAGLLYGAGAFAATIALGMAVVQFLREKK
ncbi:MAG TPA: hypothetical protein VGD29_03805 [Actinoplanes sp.]